MATRIPTTVRNAIVDLVVDGLDVGSGTSAGAVKIYSGAQPASADDAATGTLLVTVALANPAFGAASSGAASATDPASVNAATTGTAGWFRAVDRDGNTRFDGSVGVLTSVTGTASSNTFSTGSAHGLSVGNVVRMVAGITGVAAGWYVVIAVPTSTSFKLAVYGSSAELDITADGSASYATTDLTLSSLSLVAGSPVDITSLVMQMGGG